MSLVMHQVPRPILAVAVPYYKNPPPHWKKHGPPSWAPAKGHGKDGGLSRYDAKKGAGKDKEKKGHGSRAPFPPM